MCGLRFAFLGVGACDVWARFGLGLSEAGLLWVFWIIYLGG